MLKVKLGQVEANELRRLCGQREVREMARLIVLENNINMQGPEQVELAGRALKVTSKLLDTIKKTRAQRAFSLAGTFLVGVGKAITPQSLVSLIWENLYGVLLLISAILVTAGLIGKNQLLPFGLYFLAAAFVLHKITDFAHTMAVRSAKEPWLFAHLIAHSTKLVVRWGGIAVAALVVYCAYQGWKHVVGVYLADLWKSNPDMRLYVLGGLGALFALEVTTYVVGRRRYIKRA